MGDLEHDTLKIGDIVTFECLRFSCFLSAEGILVENIVASNPFSDFDNAKFCVHLQRQYSAAKEFNSFLEPKTSDDSEVDSGYLEALKTGRNNEMKLNDKDMQLKLGSPVSFGDIIQLYHIKSNKYLTIVPEKSALTEKENLRMSLDPIGSSMSWLQIIPRFKVDKEGDRILNLNEVYLKFPERPNEYLHCADRNPDLSSHREVNCSMESTSWRIGIFQTSIDSKNSSLLLASQIVYLHDPESRCNLKINLIPLKQQSAAPTSSVPRKFQKELPTVILGPFCESLGLIDSNSLWYLETFNTRVGGPVSWKTEFIRFRHLNTGLFLRLAARRSRDSILNAVNMLDLQSFQSRPNLVYKTTFDSSDPSIRFKLHDLSDSSKFIFNEKPYKLEQDGVWLKFEENNDSKFPRIHTTRDEAVAMPIVLVRYEEPPREETSSILTTAMKEPLDILAGVSAKNYLYQYLKLLKMPNVSLGEIWSSDVGGAFSLDTFQLLLERVIVFSLGFPLSSLEIDLNVHKINPRNRFRCQTLLRDQGVIESLLMLIQRIGARKQQASATKNRGNNEKDSSHFEIQKRVLSVSLEVVYYCIQDHPENQMYVADCLSVLLAYLGNSQPMAGNCVTEMLSKNIKLQRTKIGPREISTFVEKLKNSKMNSLYLGLLRSCCSCEGVGVVRNQRIISDLILSDSFGSLIRLIPNNDALHKVEWGTSPSTASFFPAEQSDQLVDGFKALKEGIPKLSIVWNSSWENLSCEFLFKKPEVSLETLFPSEGAYNPIREIKASRRLSLHTRPNTSTIAEIAGGPQIIVKYFIAQLNLSAELCLGRNYSVMGSLATRFPYETLVSLLKLDVSSSLKAAALRLILHLFVDRDPQATFRLPRLIRSWNEIKKGSTQEAVTLPSVDPSRFYRFSLVQDIVAAHLNLIADKVWDEYTFHMLDMLRSLILFGFYSSHSRLKDTFGPLVRALDRRSAEVAVPDDNTLTYKRGKGARSETPNLKSTPDTVDQDNEDEGAEDEVWQQKTLNFLESLPVMLSILSLVVVAVGLLIFQMTTNTPDGPGTWLYIVGIVILLIFCSDVTCRAYCYQYVKGEISSFLLNGFNQIDMFVVMIDIVFLCVHGGSKGQFAKTLRLVRLLRLLRILRAGRVINRLAELAKVVTVEPTDRSRYSKAHILELNTLEKMIDVLLTIEQINVDRNISILLNFFHRFDKDPSSVKLRSFVEYFSSCGASLTQEIPEFNTILFDIAMYRHAPLTQKALELLMQHHSNWDSMLNSFNQVQLLASPRQENDYKLADKIIKQLRYNVETFDLWYRLENDSQIKTAKQSLELMFSLIDKIKIPSFVLQFDEIFIPNHEFQNILQDLGCLAICIKILNLVNEVLKDNPNGEYEGSFSEGPSIITIAKECNQLLFWFFNQNITNQTMGFSFYEFFLETIELEIDSHCVLWALLIGNEALVKRIPSFIFSEMIMKVCKIGHKQAFLHFMTAVTHVGEKGMTENQLSIAMLLTSQANIPKISSFLSPIDTPEYAEKVSLMEPLASQRNLQPSDLPPELAYHITLLKLFSSCTIGRLNITTTESKLQACFNFQDVINAMLDPHTISAVKIPLSEYLLNACIDVEIKIPGLSHSGCMWQLLGTFPEVLHYAKDEVRLAEKLGWTSIEVDRHEVEYALTCVMITSAFFETYFEPANFKGDTVVSSDEASMSEADINALISQIFQKIKEIYDIDSPRLSLEHKTKLYKALQALNRNSGDFIVAEIVNTHDLPSDIQAIESEEQRLIKRFHTFSTELRADPIILEKMKEEVDDFIRFIFGLPVDSLSEPLTQQMFISSIVTHVRGGLSLNDAGEKVLDKQYIKTTVWLIQLFRKMIEFKMGMTIFERDEDGGEEQDLLAKPLLKLFNDCEVTTLCLDLIAVGIDEEIQAEAIRLAVALLFKEGGAVEVQRIMNTHLHNSPTSPLFFTQLKRTLQQLVNWHKWTHFTSPDHEADLHPDILLVRFLQLLCEGHFLPNQEIIRDQGTQSQSVNLLEDLVNYLNELSRMQSCLSTSAAIKVSATILEVVQGPCKENQDYLTMKTELIETLNRVLRTKSFRDCNEDEELELKRTSIDILQGLLEGQGSRSNVYDRIIKVLHFDVIEMLARPAEEPEDEEQEDQYAPQEKKKELSEEELTLRIESMVLLQMLCAYDPTSTDLSNASRDMSSLRGSSTASIEVFWRGELHRKIFNIPKICLDLAKTTKDEFVEDVDRSSNEAKLIDLMKRTRAMYREVKHQQDLKAWNLGYLFSPEIFDRVTWISFTLSVVINCIFIAFYSAESGTPVIKETKIVSIINALNVIMSISCGFTVVQLLFVKTPVKFRSLKADGYSLSQCIFYTATDNQTIYYFGYWVLSLLGYLVTDLCLPLLLLDIIVKNSTTRDVLNSITKPWKQLTMTFVLCIFLLYIFAYFLFFYFRTDFPDPRCITLWDCSKFVVCTASRQPGGVGDNMNHTIGRRWPLDFLFFVIVVLIILKIVFGIIIDTFSSLRSKKIERLTDTKNICFICGIEKQTFDQASKELDGFQKHVKLDHNLWNYVYFIILLWEQDKDDDDGLEYYARKAIETNEIYWFPMNKAICLEQNNEANEISQVQSQVMSELDAMESLVVQQLNNIHSEVKSFSDNISRAIKQQDSNQFKSIQSIGKSLVSFLTNSLESNLAFKNEPDTKI